MVANKKFKKESAINFVEIIFFVPSKYVAGLFLSSVCHGYKMSTNYVAICKRGKSWRSRQMRGKKIPRSTQAAM